MIDDRSKKYLKNKIIVELPELFIKISIKDRATITANNILLKKFSYWSILPNFV